MNMIRFHQLSYARVLLVTECLEGAHGSEVSVNFRLSPGPTFVRLYSVSVETELDPQYIHGLVQGFIYLHESREKAENDRLDRKKFRLGDRVTHEGRDGVVSELVGSDSVVVFFRGGKRSEYRTVECPKLTRQAFHKPAPHGAWAVKFQPH